MRRRIGKKAIGTTAGHLAMGMALGGALAVAVLATHRPILQMILNAASPGIGLALFIGIFVATIGIGATLTGLLFEELDQQ